MSQSLVRVSPLDAAAGIPVQDCSPDFPLETLKVHGDRLHSLMDDATKAVPRAALRQLDMVSRRWLKKWDNANLAEIDAIVAVIDRPGAPRASAAMWWQPALPANPAPTWR